ncbi:alpha/beta hydrolase [Gordonia sp. NPDC057258]|uniref:alpha/beta hydrolase n=1 Tax=unclassified Gordonia (in: high G+C Gram-positive bacteria) TaxID=2657482 RepID=UPI003631276A
MRLRIGIGVFLAMMLVVTACSSVDDGDLTRTRAVVDGEATLSVVDPDVTTRGVVVYFHGLDEDEAILDKDDPHRGLVRELADAGYAVVASRAGGNAFGNTASQANYAELAAWAVDRYRVSDIFFLAESMGAIAAVNLMAEDRDLQPRGLAAIGPALSFEQAPDDYRTAIAEANPDPAEVDPMRLPVESLRGNNFRFYVSPGDTLVPTSTNADAFRGRFGAVADISIVECTGPHLDASCLQGEDVVTWFSSLARW